jgi:hypothetical protein
MTEFSKLVEAVQAAHIGRITRLTRAFQLNPTCSKCKQEKYRKDFSYDNCKGMLRSWCKSCINEQSKKYHKINGRKSRGLRAYGGRPKEFDTRQSIAISSEDWALVKIRAAKEGISASELVRMFIVWGLEG